MDHEDGRYFRRRAGPRRNREMAFDRSVTLRRLDRGGLGADALVVTRNLLGPRIVGTEQIEKTRRRESSHGKHARTVQERPPVDVAVLILVVEVEQFLRKVRSLLAFHANLLCVFQVYCPRGCRPTEYNRFPLKASAL